ncbi:MAG: hemG [Chlamydiales bacterium]|jgi:oxygen-dependent protoporphyrinogen oxidase|nr:hemG [Chlamydiales bacterium]
MTDKGNLHITIIGGGISGLCTAYYLKKLLGDDLRVTLLESSSRLGGWIQTYHDDNFLFELGPRGCQSKRRGMLTLQLAEELGLTNELIGANNTAKRRFIWHNQELQALPENLWQFLSSPLTKGLISALLRDLCTSNVQKDDESIYDFFCRHLSGAIADRLIDPMVLGIYAGDMKKLSIRSCFPLLYETAKANGSLIRGFITKKKASPSPLSPKLEHLRNTPLFSFKGGMETLITSLSLHSQSSIKLNQKVTAIIPKQKQIEVYTDEACFLSDYVISTIPSHNLATLLIDWLPTASQTLEKINSLPINLVNLGYRKDILGKYNGFGYLVPTKEQEKLLGAVFDSSFFPEQNLTPNQTRLTAMVRADKDLHKDDLLDMVLNSLRKHVGIKAYPDFVKIHCFQKAIPQYHVGHYQRLHSLKQAIQSKTDRLYISGNNFHGVAVNDCVANSLAIAHDILAQVNRY